MFHNFYLAHVWILWLKLPLFFFLPNIYHTQTQIVIILVNFISIIWHDQQTCTLVWYTSTQHQFNIYRLNEKNRRNMSKGITYLAAFYMENEAVHKSMKERRNLLSKHFINHTKNGTYNKYQIFTYKQNRYLR